MLSPLVLAALFVSCAYSFCHAVTVATARYLAAPRRAAARLAHQPAFDIATLTGDAELVYRASFLDAAAAIAMRETVHSELQANPKQWKRYHARVPALAMATRILQRASSAYGKHALHASG